MLFTLLATGCGDHVVVEDYLALVAVSPSHGAANISPDVDVRLTFNDDIDEASLAGAVWIEDTVGTVLPAAVTYEADTWTVVLEPEGGLEGNSSYTVRLTTGVEGENHGALPADLSSSFATVGAVSGGGNEAPVALITAPEEPCVVGVPLLLSGLESTDPEGWPLEYSWRVLNPPEGGEFADAEAAETDFTALGPGYMVVGLTVDDGERSSSEAFLELNCGDAPD